MITYVWRCCLISRAATLLKLYESLSNELLSPSFSLLLSLYLAVLVEFICRLCSLLRCRCLCPCQQRFSPEPETQLGILTRLLAFGLAFCVAPQCIAHVNLMELLMPRTEYSSSFFSFFCANFIFIFSAFLFFCIEIVFLCGNLQKRNAAWAYAEA